MIYNNAKASLVPGSYIGQKLMHNGVKVHVQDADNIAGTVKVGVPDTNGIIWGPMWVGIEECSLPDAMALCELNQNISAKETNWFKPSA